MLDPKPILPLADTALDLRDLRLAAAVLLDEEEVELFQTLPRRLGIEDKDAHGVEDVQRGEDDVELVVDVVDGDRRDLDHHELKGPVAAVAQRQPLLADLQRQDLGGVGPAGAEPAGGVAAVEDEEHDDGGDAVGVVFRRGASQEGGDDDEHDGLEDAAVEEEAAAAEAVDGDYRDDGADHAVDGGEAGDPEGFLVRGADEFDEQRGQVVGDGVDAAELVHDHDAAGEAEAAEVLGRAVGEEEGVLVGAGGLFQRVGFDDLGEEVLDHFFAVGGEAVEDGDGFVDAVFLDEPAGGFGEEGDEDAGQEEEDELEGDGEGEAGAARVGVEAVVDPLREEEAEAGAAEELDDEVAAAGERRGRFGLPDADGGGHHADADAADDAAGDEGADVGGGGEGHGADGGDGDAAEDGFPSPEGVAEEEGGCAADEAADVVHGADGAEQAARGLMEGLEEPWVDDDAGEDAVVVAEEQETTCRRDGDEDVQIAARDLGQRVEAHYRDEFNANVFCDTSSKEQN